MLENQVKKPRRETSKWADGERYEATYLAMRCGISLEQAKELIGKNGHGREALDKLANSLKR